MGILYWTLLYLVCACQASEKGVRFDPPQNGRSEWNFQGHLNENERSIKLNPELRGIPTRNISQTMQICGFPIHHEGTSTFPFMVVTIDKDRGNAEIRLKPEIQYSELKDRYTFQIEAFDCDHPPHFSERRFVLIEVGSVNGPQFMKSAYQFTVNVSLPDGSKIGEVTAFERPINVKSDQTIQGICKYDIVSPNPVPFTVDKYGNLLVKHINIQTGVFTKYRFYVRATDCDIHQPRITSVPIIVDVYDTCKPYWTGLPTNLKYIRDSGVLPIVSGQHTAAKLHLCPNSCLNFQIVLTANLNGDKLRLADSQKCRQDSLSVMKQANMCDASVDAIDLLKYSPSSMIDSNNGAYLFGASYVPVEINLNTTNNLLGKSFSLSFWMNHGSMQPDDPKQQILCNSDLKVMNRHHYSIFLHNCKLIVLIRKEHWELMTDQYQPTEWRYGPLKEACDSQWHHYGLTFNDGTPMLQIDGEIWQTIPEQLIEKPLQKLTGNKLGTRLTVGSCFHSKTGSYVQHFKGHLTGMRLLNNRVEAINTIRCMATCGEALLLPHVVEVIDADSSVTLFSQYSIIRSHNINNLLLMFSKLSYVNTNEFNELSGQETKRNLTIDTEIKCTSGLVVRTPQHKIDLSVLEPSHNSDVNQNPPILIYSQSKVEGYLKKPVVLFPNVKFVQTNQVDKYLESCIIRPINHPIQSWEYLNWPIELAINLHLTSLNNSHGLMLEGRQPATIYELLIRKITFVTRKVDRTAPKRKFGLSCAIKKKSVTNEVINKVDIKEDDLSTYYIVDDNYQEKDVGNSNRDQVLHSANNRQGFNDKLLFHQKSSKASHHSNKVLWITIPVVILSLFLFGLVFMIYHKKRMMRFHQIARNIRTRRTGHYSMENISLPTRSDVSGDIDDASITSDCPDSGDDRDGNGSDPINKYSDDEYSSETRKMRETKPKYIYSSFNATNIPLDQPVDV